MSTPGITGPAAIAHSPILPGLVSVTFRRLTPEQIVRLAAEANLLSIEWGGDIHVPPGDREAAAAARRLCATAGIVTSAYGSYYRAGSAADFHPILDIALELETNLIRVWAGNIASHDATADQRRAAIEDLMRICDAAAKQRIGISLEFHGNTLSDNPSATLALLSAVNRPNLSTYWQPPNGIPQSECAAGLRALLPHVQNLHVFHWWPKAEDRLPLEAGIDRWREYLRIAASDAAKQRHASLEFVRGDDLDQFKRDAQMLISLPQEAAVQ
jgi:sugar phosphate isomerase/epimerase